MEYDIGQAVELFIDDIRDDDGNIVDPATLTLTVRHPDGTEDVHAIGALTHVSTGHYRFVQSTSSSDDAGEWAYRFVATSPYTVGEGVFTVRRSIVLGGASPRVAYAGTCSPWAESGDVGAPCNAYDFDCALLDDALQIASDVLFDLTRRRWPGECSETLRPCGYGTARRFRDPLQPGYFGAYWCGCHTSRTCGCRRPSEVMLPGYPVRSIQQVKIDGVTVAADRYRVDDGRWLIYLPESDSAERHGWPCCQRVDLPDTEADTWSITYTYGMAPPVGGVVAAATLACQLAMSRVPELVGDCRLPKRVTTITRQGVSLAVLDPLTLFADGQTGIPEVDLWIQSTLKGDSRRRASVHVPGATQHHRRTGR